MVESQSRFKDNQRAQPRFSRFTSNPHHQSTRHGEDEMVVESNNDLRSLHGSILRTRMLPGTSRAVRPFRDQRTIVSRLLPSGSALWGADQQAEGREDKRAETSLVVSSLDIGPARHVQDRRQAVHAWLSEGSVRWHGCYVRKKFHLRWQQGHTPS